MRKIGLRGAAALALSTALAACGGGSQSSMSDAINVVPATDGTATALATDTTTTTTTTDDDGTQSALGTVAASSFYFGVQTHFSQNWSAGLLSQVNQIGAAELRDSVTWASAEKTAGAYDFTAATVTPLTTYCANGGRLTLTIAPQNPLYDGGKSVYTDAGRAAYASYVASLLNKFGKCLTAIEVGNEINSSGLSYPTGVDKPTAYVATLKAVYAKVKPAYPWVSILGGSTNAIGTGFLDSLFAAGALSVMDAVVVHPYRDVAEGVDGEIAHLNDVMRKYGTPKPIWATEFSFDTADQRLAAAGLVKEATMLNASGVDHASWYALINQAGFPNMGLFAGTAIKTQGSAFTMLTSRLMSSGRAVRVNTGDSLTYLYRYGTNKWVVWGAPRTITFNGAVTVRDVTGTVLPSSSTVQIGAEPVEIEGATGYTLADSNVVADTLLQYGASPWTYFRRDKAGKDTALALYDNLYTSYYGDRYSNPLRINNTTGAVAGNGTNPMNAVLRYTATQTQQVSLNACYSKTVSGDGIDYHVLKNGTQVAGGILTDTATVAATVSLAVGDKLELVFGPNQTTGGDSFNYRAVITRAGTGGPVSCS
jgi:hypothetical protein